MNNSKQSLSKEKQPSIRSTSSYYELTNPQKQQQKGQKLINQSAFLPSKVQRLTGKRSYIQMPVSDKKQTQNNKNKKSAKTKQIQKNNKQTTNRGQRNRKNKNREDAELKQESPLLPIQFSYEIEPLMPFELDFVKMEVEEMQQNYNSFKEQPIGEIQINSDRQKPQSEKSNNTRSLRSRIISQNFPDSKSSSLIKNSNKSNQVYHQIQRNNRLSLNQETNSQESSDTERTITEKYQDMSVGVPLGFVQFDDDEDENLSQSMLGMPETPKSEEIKQDSQLDLQNYQEKIKSPIQYPTLKKTERREKGFTKETLNYLVKRQTHYKVDKKIIEIRHQEITQKNRQILIDWLMEVSDKFQLKRQTLQLAINFVDRYLMQVRNFELDNYQKLGITCLLIACKIEEIYYPKHKEFQAITDDNCSVEDILELETDILLKLNWLMNPATLNYWANFYMFKWDQYSKKNPYNFYILDKSTHIYLKPEIDQLLILRREKTRKARSTSSKLRKQLQDEIKNQDKIEIAQFKSQDQEHYDNFRRVNQALDMAMMDLDHYKFDYRHLAVSALVIQISLNFKKLKLQQVNEIIERRKLQVDQQSKNRLLGSNFQQIESSNELNWIYENILCQEDDEFSHMIINFIDRKCDIRITEIQEALRYMQIFFTVQLQTHLPSKLEEQEATTQEEFFGYQVYYNNIKEIICNLNSLKSELQI